MRAMGVSLKIDSLMPKHARNPRDKAMINLQRVEIGDRVGDSSLHLIAVDGMKGVVLQDSRTSVRYYLSF